MILRLVGHIFFPFVHMDVDRNSQIIAKAVKLNNDLNDIVQNTKKGIVLPFLI
ncbi:hypothetical protein N824_21165 [Pedobacter sp. V48]|nr:hypothetical protein N824_21165 [Pedobacter sp. V48]